MSAERVCFEAWAVVENFPWMGNNIRTMSLNKQND